jgi:signal peptidase I
MQNPIQIILKDINGDTINLGDIVVAKNGKLRRNNKYIYTQDIKGLWLYKMDSKGNTYEDSIGNIRVDTGISLINESDWIWIKENRN